MGRNYRWQESHTRLRFLKMFRAGMYSSSLRTSASGYELMAPGSTPLCYILRIHPN